MSRPIVPRPVPPGGLRVGGLPPPPVLRTGLRPAVGFRVGLRASPTGRRPAAGLRATVRAPPARARSPPRAARAAVVAFLPAGRALAPGFGRPATLRAAGREVL